MSKPIIIHQMELERRRVLQNDVAQEMETPSRLPALSEVLLTNMVPEFPVSRP